MLASLLLAAASSAAAYDLPALPVRLGLSGGSGVCASQELRTRLGYRFLRVVDAGDSPDLAASCEQSGGVLALAFDSPKGPFEIDTKIPAGATADQVAYVVAGSVARDPEVIDNALAAYIRFNGDLAAAGADDFAAKNWPETLTHMHSALESEVNLAPVHYALYAAEAGLDRPLRAKWHLAAFLTLQKRKAADLTDEQAKPLISAQADAKPEDDAAAADAKFAEYEALAKAHQWHEALDSLREIVAAAPWYVPAYRALAQSYDKLGWKRLAKLWKARAEFASKVNNDGSLGSAIEKRLDAVR